MVDDAEEISVTLFGVQLPPNEIITTVWLLWYFGVISSKIIVPLTLSCNETLGEDQEGSQE